MHRLIQDHLEEVLAESSASSGDTAALNHLAACEECRGEIAAMQTQAALLRELRVSQDAPEERLSPRPGFYARVMDRIEAQSRVSIWQLFFESAFGRRIAIASMALALLLGVYLVSTEQLEQSIAVSGGMVQLLPGEDQPGMVLSRAGLPDKDAVLVNLVTYREQ